MVYLSLIVSEAPIVPTLTMNQKVHVWAQKMVPDQFDDLSVREMTRYVDTFAKVMEEDLVATSNPPPAYEPETPSSG